MNQALRSPDRILPSTEAQLYEHEYSVVNVDDAFLLDDLGGIIVLPAKLVCTNLRFIIIPQVESINNLEDLLACQSRILLNALETWLGLIDTVTQCSVSSAERSALNAYLPASTQAERERRQCIDSAVLAIRVKDGRKFRIILNDCELIPRLAHILGTIANPQNLNAIPAFEFCSPGYALGPPELENGSQLYDPIVEFTKFVNRSTLPLRLSSANVDFRVCPSYPEHFVVPAAVTDSWVVAVANFRSKGRVPMVSWVSQNGRCSLWRCSQPKSMFSRSPQDEQWLIQLRSHTSKTPSETRLLLIVDARRHINAVVNKATGAGFENINTHYQGCEIEFCGIGNIHTVSSCWAKQIAAINMITIPTYVLTGDIGKPMNDPIPDTCDQCGALHSWSSSDEAPSTTLALSERKPLLGCVGISNVLASSSQSGYSPSHKHLAQSWWYDEIQAILRGTNLIVSRLCCEESVLVHCSDGWDRTAQLTSLAMLLLDSYYRTLTGFMILIEQEFIYAGHPFHTRTGAPECVSDLLALDVVEDEGPSEPRHVSSKSHRSPVFIQVRSN